MRHLLLIFILMSPLFIIGQNPKTYTYAIKGIDTLRMDVYTPAKIEAQARLPVLLWMHGGGFAGGSRKSTDEVKMMEYFTKNNFIGISISYRLLRKGKKTGFGCDCPKEEKLFTFAMATEDYLDATKFVIENQELIQVDTTKIIAGGSSAGAEGVLNAVFMKDYFLDDTSAYDDIKFAGLFSLAGAMVNSDFIKKENALPTILFHGSKDNLVPYAISAHHQCEPNRKGYIILHGTEAISKKLDDLGKSYYFHKAIGAGHELSSIPFGQLDTVLEFINKTIINKEIIQTKKTVFK